MTDRENLDAPPRETPVVPVSRRRLLALIPGSLAAVALAGCGKGDADQGAAPTVSAPRTPQDRFFALSEFLCGQAPGTLSRAFFAAPAAIYWRLVESDPAWPALQAKAGYEGGTPPASLADLEARGIFADATTGKLADRIITLWFSGLYEEDGKQKVATWIAALGWTTSDYTKPPTECFAVPMADWGRQPPLRHE